MTEAMNCMNRRAFLLRTGTAAVGTLLLPVLGGRVFAAEVARYPRARIGSLSALAPQRPMFFNYPDSGMNSHSMLVKLGAPAGGGLGPAGDVVAFNTLCPHMGGDLATLYKPDDQALGPCLFHQSTFDLTRHGMIISGHATESLPQVLLELEGDAIFAVGLIGLIYGRYDHVES